MNKEPGVMDLAQANDKPYLNNEDGQISWIWAE